MRQTRAARGAPGAMRLGALLWLGVFVLGIYLGGKFIPPYWTYLAMQGAVTEAAVHASKPGGEARARQMLLQQAKEEGLELTDEQIEVEVAGNQVVVRVSWEVAVEIPRYRTLLQFQIQKSAQL
jgi:hypothetical protein